MVARQRQKTGKQLLVNVRPTGTNLGVRTNIRHDSSARLPSLRCYETTYWRTPEQSENGRGVHPSEREHVYISVGYGSKPSIVLGFRALERAQLSSQPISC